MYHQIDSTGNVVTAFESVYGKKLSDFTYGEQAEGLVILSGLDSCDQVSTAAKESAPEALTLLLAGRPATDPGVQVGGVQPSATQTPATQAITVGNPTTQASVPTRNTQASTPAPAATSAPPANNTHASPPAPAATGGTPTANTTTGSTSNTATGSTRHRRSTGSNTTDIVDSDDHKTDSSQPSKQTAVSDQTGQIPASICTQIKQSKARWPFCTIPSPGSTQPNH